MSGHARVLFTAVSASQDGDIHRQGDVCSLAGHFLGVIIANCIASYQTNLVA